MQLKNPYRRFKIVVKQPQENHLSIDEVKKITSLKLDSEKLTLTRDRFLFAFYAGGISFTDIFRMTEGNIVKNGNYFSYKRRKNRKKSSSATIVNFLPRKAKQILNKYKDENFLLGYDGPLNIREVETREKEDQKEFFYKNQRHIHNNNLSQIAKLAGIDKKVTSKLVRDTWANIAMNEGFSTNLIGAILGHSYLGSRITIGYMGSFNQGVKDRAIKRVAELV